MLRKPDAFFELLGKLCGYISSVCLLGMIALISVDIVRRTAFQSPLMGAYEVCQLIMAVVVLFGLPYTQSKKGMVHVSFILVKLSKRSAIILWTIGQILAVLIFFGFAYATFAHAMFLKAGHATTGTILIPYWPFYIIAAIGLFFYTLIQFYDFIKSVMAIFVKEYADEISSHWNG
jgi:TRAP-type C4-dicarboxylate transport system permease small subunit